MTLSEREQQILQDIERRLYEQDPKFAQGVASSTLQAHLLRNVRRGIAMFALGFLVLIVFFFRPVLAIGVAAFLLMLGAATYTYQSVRRAGAEQMRSFRKQAPWSNFVTRLEERIKEIRERRESES